MLGVTFAFLTGGFVYDKFGINGIALFGVFMSSCQLLSLLFYFFIDINHPEKTIPPSIERSSNHPVPFEWKKIDGSIENMIKDLTLNADGNDNVMVALDRFSTSGIGANYINYILVITFGMESITIGYTLAISPVFIVEEFDKSPTVIGMMLAAGGAAGTIISIYMTLSKNGSSFVKSYFPSPYDLFVSLGGISVSVFIATVPYFSVHCTGLLFLMALNDMAAVILNEIQGTITSSQAYCLIGPMGQVVRRSFNVITAITGPVLFGIFPRLPYIVAGSVTGVWLILLMIMIMTRMKKNSIKIESEHNLSRLFPVNLAEMNFVSNEIVKRVCKVGTLSARIDEGEIQA